MIHAPELWKRYLPMSLPREFTRYRPHALRRELPHFDGACGKAGLHGNGRARIESHRESAQTAYLIREHLSSNDRAEVSRTAGRAATTFVRV